MGLSVWGRHDGPFPATAGTDSILPDGGQNAALRALISVMFSYYEGERDDTRPDYQG